MCHRKKARDWLLVISQPVKIPLPLDVTTAPSIFFSHSANMNTDNDTCYPRDKNFGLVCVGQSAWRWIQRGVIPGVAILVRDISLLP